MRKLLTILSTMTLLTTTASSVIACEEKAVPKHELTEENLTAFFADHSTFTYKGEFFYKDKSEQTQQDADKVSTENTFFNEYLVGEQLKDLFSNYFNYPEYDTIFEYKSSTTVDGFYLNQETFFPFYIEISNALTGLYFKSQNLTFKFTETKQYDDQTWINKYVEVKANSGKSIWQKKYQGYEPYFPIPFDENYTNDDERKEYLEDNNQAIIQKIEKNFNYWFSEDPGGYWFYADKIVLVSDVSYKYISTVPQSFYPDGVVLNTELNLSYRHNNLISTSFNTNIWIKLTQQHKRINYEEHI